MKVLSNLEKTERNSSSELRGLPNVHSLILKTSAHQPAVPPLRHRIGAGTAYAV